MIYTHIPDLDRIIQGFEAGQLITVAARPAIGKSALATQIALDNASKAGKRVGMLSFEMGAQEIGLRLLAMAGQIDTYALMRDSMDEHQREHVANTMGRLSNLPIFIDDQSNATLGDALARARALHTEEQIDLLIVDYVQLMSDSKGRDTNRVQELSRITGAFKRLARDELKIPVIILSQLNRALELRRPAYPMLADLRDSGGIEQDSDKVIFIHRPDKYDDAAEPNVAQLIVAKNRQGPTGACEVRWFPEYTSFRAMAREMVPA